MALTWQIVKNVWKKARWGYGIYLSMLVSLVNLLLLLRLNFDLTVLESSGVILLLFFGGVAIGHIHGLKQQATDTLLENQALADNIVARVVKELKAKD